jgi:hypothetical protein
MMDKSTTLLHSNMMLYNLINTVHWSSELYSWTVDCLHIFETVSTQYYAVLHSRTGFIS